MQLPGSCSRALLSRQPRARRGDPRGREERRGRAKRRGKKGEKPAHLLRRPSGPSRDATPLPPAGKAAGSGWGPGEEASDGGGPGATPARRTARPPPPRDARRPRGTRRSRECPRARALPHGTAVLTVPQPRRELPAPLQFVREFNKTALKSLSRGLGKSGEQQNPQSLLEGKGSARSCSEPRWARALGQPRRTPPALPAALLSS